LNRPGAYPFYISLIFAALLLCGYALFEYLIRQPVDSETELLQIIENSLDEAESLYIDEYNEFVDSSTRLYNELVSPSSTPQNYGFVYNQFAEYEFWGVSLYKDMDSMVWNGYNLTPIPLPDLDGSLRVSIQRRNNVTYLFGQRTLPIDGENAYLLTARQLEHTSNLPFGDRVTTLLSEHERLEGYFPVHFNFINPAPQDENFRYRVLSTQQSDSVGIVFATPEDRSIHLLKLNEQKLFWRSIFHLAIFTSIFILIILWNQAHRSPLFFIIRTALIPILWYLIHQSGLIDYWSLHYAERILEQPDESGLLRFHVEYLLASLMFLLLFLEVIGFTISKKITSASELRAGTLFISALYGGGSLVLILYFILTTRQLLLLSDVPLLDLELAPDLYSLSFYLSSALLFTSIAGIIVTFGYALNRWEKDKSAILAAGAAFCFILFYYLVDLFLIEQPLFNWIFVLSSILFFVLLWIVHSIHNNTYRFIQMSGFRKLMVIVFLASTVTYTIIWNSTSARTDRELRSKAEDFASEETTDTSTLVLELLTEIEKNLRLYTLTDVDESSLILQGHFQRTIRNSIRPEWRQHTFEVQLLDTLGESISDYSTNLDIPGWRSLVNMELIVSSYRGEQLRQATNRPIVWDGPPNLGENYISFNRGWIPIYDVQRPERIIAWIFAAVYVERPDYNKPMRAVLAAATGEEWKQSYYLAEFTNGRLTRSAMQGLYNNQPEYNRIPAREAEIAGRDSLAFITNISVQGEFREIILKKDENTIIKASSPVPGFNNHLFSFFRLQIVLVFFGLFIFALLAMTGKKNFTLFGQSRKFRQRLLDGLTLATILFLTGLIFATQYAVGNQNARNVERELLTRLNSLAESLRDDIELFDNQETSGRLNEFASPLNADAILYIGAELLESTTPQIFQQYLMPRHMPYPVYDFIYNRERRHYITTANIAGENLLIGYRALLNEESRPFAAVAIPTFIQSPVYREQLLQTTSYLFGVYLAIFALFIIGTVFFSNSLTKPLQIIQSGLNRISRGDMHTQVEVTSRDEIGSLAKAYNQMVERLNEARSELMRAEREAAWKEMAQQVAHEIKNPLTPMKLNLQHLQRQLEANPENVMELKPIIESTASNIIEQIESLNRIASDFSKFAKPMQDTLQPVNLNRVLESVYELYKSDSDVQITLSQPDEPVAILAVEDELRRAFINLVKNGIEAHESEQAIITITNKVKKGKAFVQIHDRGAGISPEAQDKIFVPNFSTKSSGTGLGLAITKKILEAHNAEIWFESEPGNGSTFYISIPVMTKS
jgi:signal transduction histidine kinase